MKKVLKKIVKYRYIFIIIFFGALLIFAALAFKAYMYPEDENTNYGTRLDGVPALTDASKEAVINYIKEDENVTDVNIRVQGKIINISVKTSKEIDTKEVIEAIMKDAITKFSEEELKNYDIQIFVTNTDANYYMIGYKKCINTDISWESDLIIKEEEQTEGEVNEE